MQEQNRPSKAYDGNPSSLRHQGGIPVSARRKHSNLLHIRPAKQKRMDTVQAETIRKEIMDMLRKPIRQCYPKLLQQTYIIPPVHFNRLAQRLQRVGDTDVRVLTPNSQLSDVREDESQQRIHNVLSAMLNALEEVMVVVFELDFDNYLNNSENLARVEGTYRNRPTTMNGVPAGSPENVEFVDRSSELEDTLKTGLPKTSDGKNSRTKGDGENYQARNTSQERTSQTGLTKTSHEENPKTAVGKVSGEEHTKATKTSHERSYQTGLLGTSNEENTERTSLQPLNDQTEASKDAKLTSSQPDLSVFTRPRDLPNDLQRGRFDVLIIHRQLGVMIFEVKAVGDAFGLSQALQSSSSAQHDAIRRRVERSLRQLDKEEAALRELCADLTNARPLPITKALMLPNIERRTAHAAIMQDHKLVEHVCKCLATPTLDDALDLCIFRDNLPPIGHSVHVSKEFVQQLRSDWWKKMTDKALAHTPCMDDELYESMVARFCGPATTQFVSTVHNNRADVATLHQAVLETSHCYTLPIFTSEQVDCLKMSSTLVYLTGPPATGKTQMLLLKAKDWAQQKKPVFVISLWKGSEAVSHYIYQKVKQDYAHVYLLVSQDPQCLDIIQELKTHMDTYTPRPSAPRPNGSATRGVQHRFTPFYSENDVELNSDYTWSHSRGKLCLVVDEAPWFLNALVARLGQALGRESFEMWAASSFPTGRPQAFREVVLTHTRRCPPVVVMEMQKGHAYSAFHRHPYTSLDAGVLAGMPFPTDGPPVKRIQHSRHERGVDVWDCLQCGRELASFLTADLQIEREDSSESPSPDKLHFSDVVVSGYLPDNFSAIANCTQLHEADDNCHCGATSLGCHDDRDRRSSGFLLGLTQGGVTFDLVTRTQSQKLADPSDANRVQIAEAESVLGLERPVVVVMGTTNVRRTYPRYVDPWFDVMSVCTSQLVVVGENEASVEDLLRTLQL